MEWNACSLCVQELTSQDFSFIVHVNLRQTSQSATPFWLTIISEALMFIPLKFTIILMSICFKMIQSSLHCTVSVPLGNVWESHSIDRDSMLFVTNHTPYLWSILQQRYCFIEWYQKERSKKHRIHNGGWRQALKVVTKCYISCCLTWTKTKNVKLSRVRSTNWKSSLNCTLCCTLWRLTCYVV